MSFEEKSEMIRNIEDNFEIKLPQDYIDYMIENNGYNGMSNEDYIDIWKLENIIQRNNDYKVSEFFPNLIYFGSNGGDDAYAFDKTNNMSIVRIPFIGNENNKKIVATSFNKFLEKGGNIDETE